VIHASQAKRVRAEPVSALYEQYGGLVRHCHAVTTDRHGHRVPDQNMPELEDQMATFTGAAGERSPDRLDSLVWAASPFLKRSFGPPGKGGVRRWAAQIELDEMGATAEARLRRKLAGLGERDNTPDDWDLDSFAPAEDKDDDARQRVGPRGNVRQWSR
jgi:hypothetical protein